MRRLIFRAVYVITWPGLFLLLLTTRRTRVLVLCNGEALLARSWLGNNLWHMLGGGLKRGEDPAKGACRELFEEVGIQAEPTDLHFVHARWTPKDHRFRYRYYAYVLELNKKPELTIDMHEIAETRWFRTIELETFKHGTLREVWDAWKNKG